MKKYVVLLIGMLFLCGCQTKEEIEKQKLQDELNKIEEEVNKSEIPETVKNWMFDIKTKQVLTVLCITTSNKCKSIKENLDSINIENKYFINLDETTEEEKEIYKNTFELKNYTGYLPYLIISNQNEIQETRTDVYNIEDINYLIEKNKPVVK